jgi:hypothetical protein
MQYFEFKQSGLKAKDVFAHFPAALLEQSRTGAMRL